jgi:hypothetical protein
MTDAGFTRRHALTGAAVVGVGLPLLSACGDDGGSAPAPDALTAEVPISVDGDSIRLS